MSKEINSKDYHLYITGEIDYGELQERTHKKRGTIVEMANKEYDKGVEPLIKIIDDIIRYTFMDNMNDKLVIRNKAKELRKILKEGGFL